MGLESQHRCVPRGTRTVCNSSTKVRTYSQHSIEEKGDERKILNFYKVLPKNPTRDKKTKKRTKRSLINYSTETKMFICSVRTLLQSYYRKCPQQMIKNSFQHVCSCLGYKKKQETGCCVTCKLQLEFGREKN